MPQTKMEVEAKIRMHLGERDSYFREGMGEGNARNKTKGKSSSSKARNIPCDTILFKDVPPCTRNSTSQALRQ